MPKPLSIEESESLAFDETLTAQTPLLRGGAEGSAAAGVCHSGAKDTPLHPSQEGTRTKPTLFFPEITNTLANKISFYHLLALLISLPFDYFYSHVILISFIIHTTINFKRADAKPIFTMRTLVLQSVFLITLVGSIYSQYKPQAFESLGRQVVIFIFPIFFCINPLNVQRYRPQLLMAFALCCTATILYLYGDALYVIHYFHLSPKALFLHSFTNHNFSLPIGMHATFFSLQVAIALVYLVTVLVRTNKKMARLFYLFCCAVLAAGLIQLSSKCVVAIVFVVIVFILPFMLMSGRRRVVFLSAGVLVSLCAIAVIARSDAFRERYIRSFAEDFYQKKLTESTDSRLSRWRVSAQFIAQRPITGYGSGSELPMLHEAFFKNKLYDSFLNGLNSHNQYISLWFKTGILAVLVYLCTLFYGFRMAIKTNDILFLTFMLLVAIVSISENVFDVDKGTMFYGLFYSFFVFSKPGANTTSA